jgi:ParB-like chromosome segregation protein Spo0J
VGAAHLPAFVVDRARQVPGRDGVHDFSLAIRARGLAQSVIIRSLPAGCGAGAPRAPRP